MPPSWSGVNICKDRVPIGEHAEAFAFVQAKFAGGPEVNSVSGPWRPITPFGLPLEPEVKAM